MSNWFSDHRVEGGVEVIWSRQVSGRRRGLGLAAGLALLAALALPAQAAGQSLQSGYGFGTLTEGLTARGVALGGIGVGLPGTSFHPQDPTSAADALFPSVFFTSQTSWNEADEGGSLSTSSASRFPVVGVVYPVGSVGTVSLSFSGVMDQDWNITQERLITLEGGVNTQARVTDIFRSDGGVSTLRLGVARRLGPALSVGATVGTYVGNVTRRFARSFDSLEVETSVPPFEIGGAWDYSGLVASLGATLDLGNVARVTGAISTGGNLEGTPTSDTEGGALSLEMPTEVRVGGTAYLSEQLTVSGGIMTADWSGSGSGLADVEGASVLRLGGGIEWAGASILGKPSSLRVGYRTGDEPFRRVGDPVVEESAWLAGLGIGLLQQGDVVLARTDFAVERGRREGGSFFEDFWRLSVSVRVSGL